jgi:predicted DCC family thiol-disulfide oxidoreductase YuxK
MDRVDSMMWSGPEVSLADLKVRSDAVIQILAYLGGSWAVLGFLMSLIPKPVRDAVYNLAAKNRHRIFTQQKCRVLTAEEADRFLG